MEQFKKFFLEQEKVRERIKVIFEDEFDRKIAEYNLKIDNDMAENNCTTRLKSVIEIINIRPNIISMYDVEFFLLCITEKDMFDYHKDFWENK